MGTTFLFRALALASFPSIAFATTLAAQNPPSQPPRAGKTLPPGATDQRYRYRLLGVYDETTGEPIEGVDVTDVLSGMTAQTTKTGTVSLYFLPEGGSLVRLRKVGYEMQTFTVAITPADTNPVTAILTKAVQLATVTVNAAASKYSSPRLKEAEQRMNSHAGGYFVDETEMRKHDNSTLANTLIGKMSGMMPVVGTHHETYLVSSRTPCKNALTNCTHPNCFVTVYIDGVPSPTLSDFDHMSTIDYAMAEFYPGGASVPIEYNSTGAGATCGVLLLWSREK